jgi:thymidylate kinase
MKNKFLVFEGADGSGKSSLLNRIGEYSRIQFPENNFMRAAFPGHDIGTLGQLVYAIHHGELTHIRKPNETAMQVLHMAAHIDQIETNFRVHFERGGSILLDRSWWSTYAYSRLHLSKDRALSLVKLEWPFWDTLPPPAYFCLSRNTSLKPYESDTERHTKLELYYREIIELEQDKGIEIHIIDNNGSEDETFMQAVGIIQTMEKL